LRKRFFLDGFRSLRDRIERSGCVEDVDSGSEFNVKVLVEVLRVSANLLQLFVEVASVVCESCL